MKSNKRKTIEIIVCVIMIGVSLLFLFPIIWMIANSFKGDAQIIQDMNTFGAFIPPTLDRNFFSNYITIIQNSDLMKYMANTVFYADILIVLSVLVNGLAGYALAKIKFTFREGWVLVITLLMIVPTETIITINYMMIAKAGLLNNIIGYILPLIVNPFNIFLFRQVFVQLPDELREAAEMDHCGTLKYFLNVILSIEQLISSLTKSGVQISIEKMDTYMSTLKGNSQRLLNLINNIIDTSKIDSGFYRLDKEEVNIVTLVEDTALSMVELAEVKGLEIIIDPEIEELFINCDKLDIERCIINLIGNAIKFTDVGGTITVSICELEGKVKIGVKDTGIGIDEKYHKNIFDRFGQVNSVSSEVFGGSGLGLTLTKNLINLHGGEITVISEIGKGSEFSIILPIQE